jgi:hypothetical protein
MGFQSSDGQPPHAFRPGAVLRTDEKYELKYYQGCKLRSRFLHPSFAHFVVYLIEYSLIDRLGHELITGRRLNALAGQMGAGGGGMEEVSDFVLIMDSVNCLFAFSSISETSMMRRRKRRRRSQAMTITMLKILMASRVRNPSASECKSSVVHEIGCYSWVLLLSLIQRNTHTHARTHVRRPHAWNAVSNLFNSSAIHPLPLC